MSRRASPATSSGGLRSLHGIHPVLEALSARRRSLRHLWVRAGAERGAVVEVVARARAAGVPVTELMPARFDERIPAGANAQGVLLEAGPVPELGLEELLARTAGRDRTLVALDQVEDPQNVGAIIRVAEAAGASGLLLTRRHAPPLTPAVARASAGALEWLPVARVGNLRQSLQLLATEGFWVFGAVPDAGVSLFELSERVVRGDRVLVLGAEGRGLRPSIRSHLDHEVRIPMAGRVSSLNVSAAAAVLLFELVRRGAPGG